MSNVTSPNTKKPVVAFICVHNSCRSQMAEAIGTLLAGDVFESCSAGTEIKSEINPDAVATIKGLYDIDISVTQRPKLLHEIGPVDIVVTMGCNVDCPFVPCKYREDWGLDDPSGQGHEAFKNTAETIARKVLDLRQRIVENGLGIN